MLPLLETGLGMPTGMPPAVDDAVQTLVGNWQVLLIGIVLIIATIIIVTYLKNIIANSVIGLVAWAIVVYLFKISLPFVPSLAVSAIFGLAGIGVMLILRFMGVF